MIRAMVLLKEPTSGENFVRIVQLDEESSPQEPLLSEKEVLSLIQRETEKLPEGP
jgi:hypothetical protein